MLPPYNPLSDNAIPARFRATALCSRRIRRTVFIHVFVISKKPGISISGAAHIEAARVKFRYWPTEIFRVRNTPTTFNLSNMDMLGSSSANSGWASRA